MRYAQFLWVLLVSMLLVAVCGCENPQLKQCKKLNQDLNRKIATQQQKAAKDRKKDMEMISGLMEKFKQLNDKQKATMVQLNGLKAQNIALKNKNRQMKAQLAKRITELQQLREKIAIVQKTNDNLNNKMLQTKELIDQMSRKMNEAQQMINKINAQNRELNAQLDKLKTENEKLKAANARLDKNTKKAG